MRAMIWKEIRQNLVWSVLLLLGLGAALAWAVAAIERENPALDVTHLVSGPPAQMVTTFGFPLAAFVLALLQILPETSADRWALLVHRPLARTGIFAAKTAAGAALYLAVALVPFLLAAWWTATPGHLVAPFSPAMLIPGLEDALTGFAWYFAGLLFALREARWFGTKALPLLSALSVSLLTHASPAFPYLMPPLGVGGIVLLAAAARRAFLDFRLERPLAAPSRLALAFVFLPALALLPGLFGSLGSFLLLRGGESSMRFLVLSSEGKPYWGISHQMANGVAGEELTELDGTPVSAPPGKTVLETFESLPSADFVVGGATEAARFSPLGYRANEHYVIPCQSDREGSGGARPRWFFDPATHRYLGFSDRERRFVGSFGPRGFLPPSERPPAEEYVGWRMAYRSFYLRYLPSVARYRDGVWLLDPDRQIARRLLDAGSVPDLEEAMLARINPWRDKEAVRLVFVQTADRILVLTPEGVRLASLDVGDWEALRRHRHSRVISSCDVGAVPVPEPEGNRYRWVLQTHSYGEPYDISVRWYDADGKLTEEKTFPGERGPAGRSPLVWTLQLPEAASWPLSALVLSRLHRTEGQASGDLVPRHALEERATMACRIAATLAALVWLRRMTAAAGASLLVRFLGAAGVLLFGPLLAPAFRLAREKKPAPPTPPIPARESPEIFEPEPTAR